MKEAKAVLLLFLILSVAISPASAESHFSEKDGGTSGIGWKMKVAFQKVQIAFTFDSAKKASKSLSFANERLQEMELLAQNADVSRLEAVRNEHRHFLDAAAESIESISLENPSEELELTTALHSQLIDDGFLLDSIEKDARLHTAYSKSADAEKFADAVAEIKAYRETVVVRLENRKSKTNVKSAFVNNKSLEEAEKEASAYEEAKLDSEFMNKAKDLIEAAEFAADEAEKLISKKDDPNAKKQLALAISFLESAKKSYEAGEYLDASNMAATSRKMAIFASSGIIIESAGSNGFAPSGKAPDSSSDTVNKGKSYDSKISPIIVVPSGNAIAITSSNDEEAAGISSGKEYEEDKGKVSDDEILDETSLIVAGAQRRFF